MSDIQKAIDAVEPYKRWKARARVSGDDTKLAAFGDEFNPAKVVELHNQLAEYKQRAEAAEALEMQEPVAYGSKCRLSDKWGYIWHTLDDVQGWVNLQHQSDDSCTYSSPIPLYAKPFPAPKQEEK